MSFRFQVIAVTTLAVALAGGVLLGVAALNAPPSRAQQGQAGALDDRNQALQQRVDQLQSAMDGQSDLAQQLAPAVLSGRLTNVSVLLVVAPGGAPYVDSVARMLTVAGAVPTGTVELSESMLAADNSRELLDLAEATLPPSVSDGLPATTDGLLASSALLAGVLVRHPTPVTDDDLRAVVAAYASQGFISAPRGVTGAADTVVVVAGPATGGDVTRRAAALYTVVGQFAHAGPVVVAASGATGTVVAQVRADHSLAANVSTVDNVASVTGQLVTAWALANLVSGHSGQYGDGPGAVALPALVP